MELQAPAAARSAPIVPVPADPRGGTLQDGVLTPRKPPAGGAVGRAVVVTGPGRLERAYQRQVQDLAAEVGDLHRRQHAAERELEVARLVERGTLRLVDRIEHELVLERQRKNRVLVTLGAVQAENARLREALVQARTHLARIESRTPAAPVGLWGRLLGRRAVGRR